jgi:hypothetical protein
VEVVGHDLRLPTLSLDGRGVDLEFTLSLDDRGVDLEELLKVYGTIVLLRDIWPELGGRVDPPQVRSEGPTPGPIVSNVIIVGGAALPLVSLRGVAGGGVILLGLSATLACTFDGSPGVFAGGGSASRVTRRCMIGPEWAATMVAGSPHGRDLQL